MQVGAGVRRHEACCFVIPTGAQLNIVIPTGAQLNIVIPTGVKRSGGI